MELALFDETKFNHAVKLASTLAKSKIVPVHFQNKPEEVFAAMVLGSELGFSPMQAMNAIVFISGQATLKAQSLMAIVRAKCPSAVISFEMDEQAKAVKCTAKRDAEDPGYTAIWDMQKAKAMGLENKDNYKRQPLNMLKWRAVSEALKVVFPDYIQGINSTEEMEYLPPLRNELLVTKEEMDADFPIPEAEQVVGDEYRVQNGKFRGKQLKDIETADIESYLIDLETRKNKKPWENELEDVLRQYLTIISVL